MFDSQEIYKNYEQNSKNRTSTVRPSMLVHSTEKVYSDFRQLIVYNNPMTVFYGEKTKKENSTDVQKIIGVLQAHANRGRSLDRTKQNVKDIVLCNQFDMFCTFTFANMRDHVDLCKSRMQYWLQSQQKLYGKFDYVIVPEFHKDGVSLHFHALIRGFKGRLDKATNKKTGELIKSRSGKQVYNIPGFTHGFASATYLDNQPETKTKTANYITKYITKDMPNFSGKKRYWCSQSLARPVRRLNVEEEPYITNDNVVVYESDNYTIYIVPNDQASPTFDPFYNVQIELADIL